MIKKRQPGDISLVETMLARQPGDRCRIRRASSGIEDVNGGLEPGDVKYVKYEEYNMMWWRELANLLQHCGATLSPLSSFMCDLA